MHTTSTIEPCELGAIIGPDEAPLKCGATPIDPEEATDAIDPWEGSSGSDPWVAT